MYGTQTTPHLVAQYGKKQYIKEKNEMKNKSVRFITLTAMLIAMLIACQTVFKNIPEPVTKQLITGSLVNLILISACLLVNWKSGAIVAIVSPFLASLMKVVPAAFELVPFIAFSNFILVITYALIIKLKIDIKLRYIIAAVVGAGLKFGVIYLLTNKVLLLFWTPAPMIVKQISSLFGTTQFITALIGGIVAMVVVPLVQLGLGKNGKN